MTATAIYACVVPLVSVALLQVMKRQVTRCIASVADSSISVRVLAATADFTKWHVTRLLTLIADC